MKTKAKRRIPDFRSEAEEQEFWATHSAMDYAMELVEAEVKLDPLARTRLVSLRLPERLIRDLKEIAQSEGLPYQKLIKLCLQKFVEVRKAQAHRLVSTR